MTTREPFVAATAAYERWRASRIPTVEADLETKHEKLASSPFMLLRGTYYRFLAEFGGLLPDVAGAPKTVAVGDLHVENFGTWRDHDGRLAWGVNDFDEIDMLPYTVDLVRLATSASLAIAAGHLKLEPADAAEQRCCVAGARASRPARSSRSCSATAIRTSTGSPQRRSSTRCGSSRSCGRSRPTSAACRSPRQC